MNGGLACEKEVIEVALDLLYLGRGQVVRSRTNSGLGLPEDGSRMLDYVRANLEGLREETVEDFARKNRDPHPVEGELNPGGLLNCVGDGEFRRVFRNGEDGEGWERFRKSYPDSEGTLRLSRVGFDFGIE